MLRNFGESALVLLKLKLCLGGYIASSVVHQTLSSGIGLSLHATGSVGSRLMSAPLIRVHRNGPYSLTHSDTRILLVSKHAAQRIHCVNYAPRFSPNATQARHFAICQATFL